MLNLQTTLSLTFREASPAKEPYKQRTIQAAKLRR